MIPNQSTQKSGPLDPAPLGVRVMRTVQLGSGSNTNILHFQGPYEGDLCSGLRFGKRIQLLQNQHLCLGRVKSPSLREPRRATEALWDKWTHFSAVPLSRILCPLLCLWGSWQPFTVFRL